MLQIGAASKVINNELGTFLQAAGHDKRALSIRDDLEANALYLSDGREKLLLVSCDLAGLESADTRTCRAAMAAAAGMNERSILIAATHTHSGPSLLLTSYRKPVDTAYVQRLQGYLGELARQAVVSARPGQVAWGMGQVQIGYNRRCCWLDGSHTMHGDTKRPDFTGLEGPDDPRHFALFARDAEGDGKLLAVLHNNTSHPTCFYGADFYSADFPGAARAHLREVLGPVPVLFFNGAFGDIAIEDQLAPIRRSETSEQKMQRVAHQVAGETLRLLQQAEFRDQAILAHACKDLKLAVRLGEPDRLAWARDVLRQVDAGRKVDTMDRIQAFGVVSLQERFGRDPADSIPVHAIRIGEAAIATQPCELFCQFGLDIKRRSPSPIAAVFGITDGYCGYCPTLCGVLSGGYSGEATAWCRLEPYAGYKIVDAAARLLHALWKT